MNIAIYIASAIAIFASLMVVTRANAVSALLYMIVSLLSIAVIFYLIGAPFIAALEIIIYAGAIMVLFVFVVMMLNLGKESVNQEKEWLPKKIWIIPSVLSAILLAEIIYILLSSGTQQAIASVAVGPKQVGTALFSPYLVGTELAAFLLLSGMVGAYHLGKKRGAILHRYMKGGPE